MISHARVLHATRSHSRSNDPPGRNGAVLGSNSPRLPAGLWHRRAFAQSTIFELLRPARVGVHFRATLRGSRQLRVRSATAAPRTEARDVWQSAGDPADRSGVLQGVQLAEDLGKA